MTELLDRPTATLIAERLRVLAHPLRLTILTTLLAGEQSVAGIDAATGIGQPTLSQQLAELRRAKLVTQRRDAKTVVYRLADSRTEATVRLIVAAVAGREPLDAMFGRPATTPHPPRRETSAAMFAVVDPE